MKQNDNEYALNFVVPVGATGPTGAKGNQGSIGPTTKEDVVYLLYNNSFTQGLLTVFNNTVLPDDSGIFSVGKNEVIINEPGNYEYTLCGKINGKSIVSIQAIDSDGALANLETIHSLIKSMLFSKTKILQAKSKQRIQIRFWPNETDANAEPLKLLIKRLPF